MTCRKAQIGDSTVIMCSRGKSTATRCSVTGCQNAATYLCDYPLAGDKAGKTCDRPVCNVHRHIVSPKVDYCPPHARLHAESK